MKRGDHETRRPCCYGLAAWVMILGIKADVGADSTNMWDGERRSHVSFGPTETKGDVYEEDLDPDADDDADAV